MLSLRAFAKNVGRKSVRRLSVGKAKVDVILRYVSYLGNSFIYLVGLTLCLRKRIIALKSLPSPSRILIVLFHFVSECSV